MDTLTPDSAEQLAGLPGVAVQETPGVRICQLFYNFRKPKGHPLADARVRHALTYAIDGESLIRDVLIDFRRGGPREWCRSRSKGRCARHGAYDFSKAKALLKSLDAGGPADHHHVGVGRVRG